MGFRGASLPGYWARFWLSRDLSYVGSTEQRGTGEKRRGSERKRNSNREPTIAGQWHSRLQRPSVIKVGFPSPPSHLFGFSLDANYLFRPCPVGKPTLIPARDPALVFPGGRHLAQLHHLAPLSWSTWFRRILRGVCTCSALGAARRSKEVVWSGLRAGPWGKGAQKERSPAAVWSGGRPLQSSLTASGSVLRPQPVRARQLFAQGDGPEKAFLLK